MFNISMSVEQRIAALQNIFADFGITVPANSILDQAIRTEFGRGKRSKLTPLLMSLQHDSDAGLLAMCIGGELIKQANDPHLIAVGRVLLERMPSLLNIIDMRQQTQKRELLLSQLLDHFSGKLPVTPQTDRMLRMLHAARNQLQTNLQLSAMSKVVEYAGNACNMQELQRFGKILQGITPALVALEYPDYSGEQKVNYCVHALRVIANELRLSHLQSAADIIDHVHWLAKVTLPELADKATVEQALQNLGISIGTITGINLRAKARALGLEEKEIIQIIYAGKSAEKLDSKDQELLAHTHENQQYAAFAGYLGKLGADFSVSQLEQIGVVGQCLAALRQTYYELKTDNLGATNFTETLGVLVSGLGALTHNSTLTHVGNCILTGVQTYVGMMAVPGGAAIAVPLAVCSVLSKMFLSESDKNNAPNVPSVQSYLHSMLGQLIMLQQEMRQQFAHLYIQLQDMHGKTIQVIDQGFADLTQVLQLNAMQNYHMLHRLDCKANQLQYRMSKEFADLYMEYIRDPIEEIDFATKYGWQDIGKMQQNKHKLAMWLLYKSKHPKVNGSEMLTTAMPEQAAYLLQVLAQMQDEDSTLCLLNRYLNLTLQANLPEDLPHLPTWLQAAQLYVLLAANGATSGEVNDEAASTTEVQKIADIIAIGARVLAYLRALAANTALWHKLQRAMQREATLLIARWQGVQPLKRCNFLCNINALPNLTFALPQVLANAVPQTEQLEAFTPINVDVTEIWRKHLQYYVAKDFTVYSEFALGSLCCTFCVDPAVNNFHTIHMPFGAPALPDAARCVIFRIDVHFKSTAMEQPMPLLSAWFAYDLATPARRFNEYYNLKFKYGLRHTDYNWIALNGMSNQVNGYADTVTKKLIDYDRLAVVYQEWLGKALPVNATAVAGFVQQNSAFAQQYRAMLDRQDFVELHAGNINLLSAALQTQLRQEVLQQRISFAVTLQQDQQLLTALNRLEAFYNVLVIFSKLLNIAIPAGKLATKFTEVLQAMRLPSNLEKDFVAQLQVLFTIEPPLLDPKEHYLHSDVYLKLRAALTQLQLLRTSVLTSSLQYSLS